MRRITLALTAVAVAGVTAATALGSQRAAIAPHAYVARIVGAKPALLNGTWRLSVTTSTFAVNKGATAAVSGRVRIAGNRITFHDLGGPYSCRGALATGVYSWRVTGKRLVLTAVREPCAGRRTILTRPFTRIR
jgi:hypothetical protein